MGNAVIIETSNIALALIALYGAIEAAKWKLKNNISEENVKIVTAWVWMFSAVGIRAGWFGASRHLAQPGETWALYDYRGWVVVGTACMFAWGMYTFIRLIEENNPKRHQIVFAVILAVSLIFGYY